jgi:hypothetical protein
MAPTSDAPQGAAPTTAKERLTDSVIACGRLYARGLITREEVYNEAIEAFTKWMYEQEAK